MVDIGRRRFDSGTGLSPLAAPAALQNCPKSGGKVTNKAGAIKKKSLEAGHTPPHDRKKVPGGKRLVKDHGAVEQPSVYCRVARRQLQSAVPTDPAKPDESKDTIAASNGARCPRM